MAVGFRGGVLVALLSAKAVAAAEPFVPALPRGTPADLVLKTQGRPRGHIATGEREIWTYDTFQVTFVNGKVEQVSARTSTNVKAEPARSPASAKSAGAGSPTRGLAAGQPVPTTSAKPLFTPPAASAEPASSPVLPARRAPKAAEKRDSTWDRIERVVISVGLGIGLLGAGLGLWLGLRRKSAKEDPMVAPVRRLRPTDRG